MFFRKNCYYCKFCYKVKKELTCQDQKDVEAWLNSGSESFSERKVSDLTETDLEDMYGLRQEYDVKCFKDQWDEEIDPELKLQNLKDRDCKYFLNRKKNLGKTHKQAAREQLELMNARMHKETIQWMQVSFSVGIASIIIGLISRIPNAGERFAQVLEKIKQLFL
jgi:hypothetical protein